MESALEGKLVISICAGVTIAQLQTWVPKTANVVRAMPNTPCKVCVMSLFLQLLLYAPLSPILTKISKPCCPCVCYVHMSCSTPLMPVSLITPSLP